MLFVEVPQTPIFNSVLAGHPKLRVPRHWEFEFGEWKGDVAVTPLVMPKQRKKK